MKPRVLPALAVFGVVAFQGRAESIQVFSIPDAVVLAGPGSTTTVHIWAEVLDGEADNGIWAYAFDALFSNVGILEVVGVDQLGDPDALFSDDGMILADGLHGVYGGDGGFFSDQNRGVGTPYELLAVELNAVAEGSTDVEVSVASNVALLGIPEGVLLQQPGDLEVQYSAPLTITVIPEPGTLSLLLVSSIFVGRRLFRI